MGMMEIMEARMCTLHGFQASSYQSTQRFEALYLLGYVLLITSLSRCVLCESRVRMPLTHTNIKDAHKLGQFRATAIAGNDITSSCL